MPTPTSRTLTLSGVGGAIVAPDDADPNTLTAVQIAARKFKLDSTTPNGRQTKGHALVLDFQDASSAAVDATGTATIVTWWRHPGTRHWYSMLSEVATCRRTKTTIDIPPDAEIITQVTAIACTLATKVVMTVREI